MRDRPPVRLEATVSPEPTLQACFEVAGRVGADAKLGKDTAAAVRAFKAQEKLGFETMGDVGPGTVRRLDELCP